MRRRTVHIFLGIQPQRKCFGKEQLCKLLALFYDTRQSSPQIFVNARGNAMTRSGFEYVLGKHTQVAIKSLPSLRNKVVTPHILNST